MSFIQKQLICNKNLKMKISFSKTSSFNFSKKQFHWKVNKSSMTGISTSCLYNTPNSITKSLKSSSYMYIGTISLFSTTNDKKQENEDVDEEDPSDYDNYDDYDDGGSATTAKDRVLGWGQAIGSVLLLSLGIVGLYFVGTTLFPGRMGPNSVYADAFEIVRYNDEVIAMTGEPMKAFGKDSGNDGRRTNIEFRQFKEDDGSDRTRIRFNVKGPRGQAIVWAEISSKMASNEYVFLICQDRRSKKVVTIQDNRERLRIEKESGNSPEALSIISSLLGSGTNTRKV